MNYFETLPEHLITRILGCFQTQKFIRFSEDLSEYEINKLISKRRKNLINSPIKDS